MSAASVRPSRAPRMTADDVGHFYVRDDGSVWKLVSYAGQPTATLERCERVGESIDVERGHLQRVSGVVGCALFEGYRRLVPEGEGV